MDQEVKYIKIEDLVLWTENPRDPIDEKSVDQDIVDRALSDDLDKWSLAKLAESMGYYYDFSELPTVVYHGTKPVVYDGNRRIILGKIKHNLVKFNDEINIKIPDFPSEIPCNVCVEKVALQSVYRKHSESGSWKPLERDMFLHKFMGEPKSLFLTLDESTCLITANPHLNQRFVKDEVFKEVNLEKMGFSIEKGALYSVHDDQDEKAILSDISRKVESKDITTRKNRGKIVESLDPSSQEIIALNKNNNRSPSVKSFGIGNISKKDNKKKRRTKRTPKKVSQIFGGPLYLQMGSTSDLYRDIVDLYEFYIDNKKGLSQTFRSIIRMSLRLLCETASKDTGNKKMDGYFKKHFKDAKNNLDEDAKTTLSSQNVTVDSIVQLLHIGAHDYESSQNLEQTIALSIILGEILTISHGKGKQV